jgi:hypothetical protein
VRPFVHLVAPSQQTRTFALNRGPSVTTQLSEKVAINHSYSFRFCIACYDTIAIRTFPSLRGLHGSYAMRLHRVYGYMYRGWK